MRCHKAREAACTCMHACRCACTVLAGVGTIPGVKRQRSLDRRHDGLQRTIGCSRTCPAVAVVLMVNLQLMGLCVAADLLSEPAVAAIAAIGYVNVTSRLCRHLFP
jgi:hypothetical protein